MPNHKRRKQWLQWAAGVTASLAAWGIKTTYTFASDLKIEVVKLREQSDSHEREIERLRSQLEYLGHRVPKRP